jgi:hypothetical protein
LLLSACSFEAPVLPGDPGADAMGDSIDSIDPDPDPEPKAWLDGWARRKPITLSASQIEAPGDGALADFPVLVSITDPQIAASALAGGEDIVFTAGDARTVLASEIESFTRADNQLVAWVKVLSLSATTDTRLYVYYGNPSPPAPTPGAVWTADFLGVWHLHQNPGPGGAGEIRDATSGNRDGTAMNMESTDSVPARIGRGLSFNGMDEYLDFNALNVGNTFTISMWVQFVGVTSVRPLMANSTLGGDTNGFRFFINTANTLDRRIYFETGNGTTGSADRAATESGAMPLNTLTHLAVVVNRTAATATIFVNGAAATTDTSIRNDFRIDSDFELARLENTLFHFPGILDEIRVAGALRSPEWIQTSFNNQAQPRSFHTLEPEELAP